MPGLMARMAQLAAEVRDVTDNLGIKACETELKVLRSLVELVAKQDRTSRVDELVDRVNQLQSALSQAQGFAGRLSESPEGIN